MFKNMNIVIVMLTLICAGFMAGNAHAQLEFMVDGYEEKYFNHDEGPGAEIPSVEGESHNSQYMYEESTIKALSYMFWALGLYKTSDDYAIDQFLQINECELYKKFFGDELEWSDIREAARDFIKANKSDFPTRFTFVLPLKLANYSVRRKAFEIQKEYKIFTARRFELYAKNANAKPCSLDTPIKKGYPRILNMEFSRPFNLTHIPMSKEVADEYIKKTMALYKRYDEKVRSKRLMYKLRDAFLVLRIKVFAHGRFLPLHKRGYPVVQMMGSLESYAIYSDSELTNLLYKESYVSNKKKGKLDMKLKEQYEILRERSKAGGILNN